MASFVSNVKLSEPTHCPICREKKSTGRSLKDYKPELNFVCEDCYKRYFGEIAHVEKKGFRVLYRPVDIVEDEYRHSHIFASSLIFDTIKWGISCGVMWLVFVLLSCVYGQDNFISFALIPTSLFSIFSLFGALKSIIELVKGLFQGMNHLRRFLLFAKGSLYFGLFLLNGVNVYSWISQIFGFSIQ